MTDPFEDPDVAISALEGLVEEIVAGAMMRPLDERRAAIEARMDQIREIYAARFHGDARGLAEAMELARLVEEWVVIRVAEIEERGAGRA